VSRAGEDPPPPRRDPPPPPGEATREHLGGLSTVAGAPPLEHRARPTWGLREGDEIAPGRTILRRIGGGRRFEVFLVWDDRRLAMLVAKVLRPDHVEHPEGLHELAREADALARLGHPVVVRGFDAVLRGRFPHLLIEHLEGPTLHELLDERGGDEAAGRGSGRGLPLEQLLPLGLHIASALHYLAGEGMVHLDVKPENIVMGAPPRLIDLSVARTVAEAAALRHPTGTDAYMAPELCAAGAAGPIGPPADVFGLAATLQHALTGAPPFPRPPGTRESRDPAVRFPQLVAAPAELPRRTPPELARALAGGLARDPAERPTAVGFASALEPLVGRLPRRMLLGRRA
jgi:eukaryotic-like serine/threonine-protein kinase